MKTRKCFLDGGEIRPEKRNLWTAVSRETNLKCLLLTTLVLLCSAATVFWRLSHDPEVTSLISSTPPASHISVRGDKPTGNLGENGNGNGKVLMPTALILLLYLLYLVECFHSKAREMIARSKLDVNTVYRKVEEMRRARPVVWWQAVCYHFERRTQQFARYRHTDSTPTSHVSTSSDQERVNTHSATSYFFYGRNGVRDISRDLVDLEKFTVTQVQFKKAFIFHDSRSATDFEDQRASFFQDMEDVDSYVEMREGMELAKVMTCEKMTCWTEAEAPPWFGRLDVFWLSSFFLLSWPLRVILELNTAHVVYQVTKVFGTNCSCTGTETETGAANSNVSDISEQEKSHGSHQERQRWLSSSSNWLSCVITFCKKKLKSFIVIHRRAAKGGSSKTCHLLPAGDEDEAEFNDEQKALISSGGEEIKVEGGDNNGNGNGELPEPEPELPPSYFEVVFPNSGPENPIIKNIYEQRSSFEYPVTDKKTVVGEITCTNKDERTHHGPFPFSTRNSGNRNGSKFGLSTGFTGSSCKKSKSGGGDSVPRSVSLLLEQSPGLKFSRGEIEENESGFQFSDHCLAHNKSSHSPPECSVVPSYSQALLLMERNDGRDGGHENKSTVQCSGDVTSCVGDQLGNCNLSENAQVRTTPIVSGNDSSSFGFGFGSDHSAESSVGRTSNDDEEEHQFQYQYHFSVDEDFESDFTRNSNPHNIQQRSISTFDFQRISRSQSLGVLRTQMPRSATGVLIDLTHPVSASFPSSGRDRHRYRSSRSRRQSQNRNHQSPFLNTTGTDIKIETETEPPPNYMHALKTSRPVFLSPWTKLRRCLTQRDLTTTTTTTTASTTTTVNPNPNAEVNSNLSSFPFSQNFKFQGGSRRPVWLHDVPITFPFGRTIPSVTETGTGTGIGTDTEKHVDLNAQSKV